VLDKIKGQINQLFEGPENWVKEAPRGSTTRHVREFMVSTGFILLGLAVLGVGLSVCGALSHGAINFSKISLSPQCFPLLFIGFGLVAYGATLPLNRRQHDWAPETQKKVSEIAQWVFAIGIFSLTVIGTYAAFSGGIIKGGLSGVNVTLTMLAPVAFMPLGNKLAGVIDNVYRKKRIKIFNNHNQNNPAPYFEKTGQFRILTL
jgi:hypothetical protein